MAKIEVKYAVLAASVHTPRIGTMKETCVLKAPQGTQITRMYVWDDLFILETTKGQVCMPIEHVRYFEALEDIKD